MSPLPYENQKYIHYIDYSSQHTKADNINIFNFYEYDTLMSMWVRIRSVDCDICNKGWTGETYNWCLSTKNGRPTFNVHANGLNYEVVNGMPVIDDVWRLICWGKFRVENGVKLFVAVDGGPAATSPIISNNLDIGNNIPYEIAYYDYDYSRLSVDELFILKGIKYTQTVGQNIYGNGITHPGFPPYLWPSQNLQCYWQFNNPNTVTDMSGNGNNGSHFNNPMILSF